jgi:hypothetical protein
MSRFAFKSGSVFGLFPLAALALAACVPLVPEDDPDVAPPEIAYGLPIEDDSGYWYVLDVVSSGGPVTRFFAEPELPENALLDTATGRIVYELPEGEPDWETHVVFAEGPGGVDTATVNIPVYQAPMTATLVVRVGLRPASSGSLAKPAAHALQRLVVTLTSDDSWDSVIRDTILASSETGASFSPSPYLDQQVLKAYEVKPMRSWTVEAKTLDVNGTVIHQGSMAANHVMVGETRALTLNLSSRYTEYVATFRLPDSLGAAAGPKTGLNVGRLVMKVDGSTVRDTSSSTRFNTDPFLTTLVTEYLRTDTAHVMELRVHARSLSSWPDSMPVFKGTFTIPDLDSAYTLTLNVDPHSAGTAIPGLMIRYEPRVFVIVEPLPPNPLPKR